VASGDFQDAQEAAHWLMGRAILYFTTVRKWRAENLKYSSLPKHFFLGRKYLEDPAMWDEEHAKLAEDYANSKQG